MILRLILSYNFLEYWLALVPIEVQVSIGTTTTQQWSPSRVSGIKMNLDGSV